MHSTHNFSLTKYKSVFFVACILISAFLPPMHFLFNIYLLRNWDGFKSKQRSLHYLTSAARLHFLLQLPEYKLEDCWQFGAFDKSFAPKKYPLILLSRSRILFMIFDHVRLALEKL